MKLNEIANLDEVKKALRDRYLRQELAAVQAGYLTLDDLKNQNDDDLRGSWVDWQNDPMYSDPKYGGLSLDELKEAGIDKDTFFRIVNDKGTMPTRDEVVKYVSDNLSKDEGNSETMTVEEYSPADEDFVKYVKKVYGDGPFTVEELKDIEKNEYDRFFDDQDGIEELDNILNDDEEPESTNLSNIAKSITQNDLGRSL